MYFEKIQPFVGKPFIKVLTGIRRSGKSSLLQLLKAHLLTLGVDNEQIITINFESFAFDSIASALDLYGFVKQRISNTSKTHYLLFDEIQEVHEWEKAVNALAVDFSTDIYITGSNSRLLSSELATYLAGRYVEIPVFTLSFREYLSFLDAYSPTEKRDIRSAFVGYLRAGGFPVVHTSRYDMDTTYKIVHDIYSSVILRDTVQRHNIRDIELLERVVRYVFDNVGNSFSAKNVADYFKSQQRTINLNTVYSYLEALESAFIVYRTPRYNVRGKEILKTQEKYYLSDVSLLYAVMGYRDTHINGVLENIVFLDLKRRGYSVYVGKLGNKEIDFIAENRQGKVYVQVAYKLESEATVEREFGSLIAIPDQHPKYVVTMDEFWKENVDGVQHRHIADFLLKEQL